jgi:hypothetical protein
MTDVNKSSETLKTLDHVTAPVEAQGQYDSEAQPAEAPAAAEQPAATQE